MYRQTTSYIMAPPHEQGILFHVLKLFKVDSDMELYVGCLMVYLSVTDLYRVMVCRLMQHQPDSSGRVLVGVVGGAV